MRIIIAILLALLLVACTTTKYVPVETKVTETVTKHDTTIVVKLEQMKDTVIVQADPVTDEAHSYLQNNYCYSKADYVEGHLQHILNVKEDATADTIVVTDVVTREILKEVPKIVEVEKSLSFREKLGYALEGLFFILIIPVLSTIIYFIVKRYRI